MSILDKISLDDRTKISWVLMLLAAGVCSYDIIYNPQAGRECTLSDSLGYVITGNCSYIMETYENKDRIILDVLKSEEYLNRPNPNNVSLIVFDDIEDIVPTTLPPTKLTPPQIEKPVEGLGQGSYSQHNPEEETVSTTTLPEVYEYMLDCVNTSECVLVKQCCFNVKPYPINIKYEKYWKSRLVCEINSKCSNMIAPTTYKARCEEGKCIRILE